MITTKFDAASTAEEVAEGTDLTGKRAVITGGASGIGLETARVLAGAGAEVVLAVRDVTAGRRAANLIPRGDPPVSVAFVDLTNQSSVASFLDSWEGPVDILIDNAGVMATPETRTADGWELQFATNHLGHFVLTTGLYDALAAADGAKVVVVSSAAHLRSPVVFEDLNYDRRPYDRWTAYGQSKTANILFAVEANRRWEGAGITVNALAPGGVRTNLQRHQTAEELRALFEQFGGEDKVPWKTVGQGAATSVLLATRALPGGRYFENCREAGPADTRTGVADYALDPEAAERLWRESQKLLRG